MNSDLIVTGIPRSGTSFLTSTLHKFENCVAINEPEEIFAHLDDTGAPWGMASYYHSLRQAIIDRRPIVNKLVDGKVIEDTAVVDSEQSYIPHIDGDLVLNSRSLETLAEHNCRFFYPDSTCFVVTNTHFYDS